MRGVRARCPRPCDVTDSVGPQPIRTATSTFQASGAAGLHQGPGMLSRNRSLRSSAEATAALAAISPMLTAHRGLQVPQEPESTAPNPAGLFRPESDHLLRLVARRRRVESNRGRADRAPTSTSTASDATLTPCPAIFQGAERESLRPQYGGKPAAGSVGLFFVAMRVMAGRPRRSMYFNLRTSIRRQVGIPSRSRQSFEEDLASTLDSLDLIVGQSRRARRKIAPLEVDDVGATNRANPFRPRSVSVPHGSLGESIRFPPPQCVQDLASGPGHHRSRHRRSGTSSSRHKDHIRWIGSEVHGLPSARADPPGRSEGGPG